MPYALQGLWLKDMHEFLGHTAFLRIWAYCLIRKNWSDMDRATFLAKRITSTCSTCQACVRARRLTGKIRPTPIPESIMSSVALDIFQLPEVTYQKEKYECIIVCLDRHSGWMQVVPTQ